MSETTTEFSGDKRMHTDRREFGWLTVCFGFLRSRRKASRRLADGDVLFLDWHHPWLFFLAVGTMLLCVADAFMTLRLIERGMIEANPVMAWTMQYGVAAFTGTKLAMTAFGIFTLVYLAKAKFMDRIRTGLFLTAFFSGYACLVCYETVQLLQLL